MTESVTQGTFDVVVDSGQGPEGTVPLLRA